MNDKKKLDEEMKLRLNEALIMSGKELADLARYCEVTYAGAKKWFMTGKLAKFRVKPISDFLNCSPVWLATGEGRNIESNEQNLDPDEFLITCSLMVDKLAKNKGLTDKQLYELILSIYKDGFKTKTINPVLLNHLIT